MNIEYNLKVAKIAVIEGSNGTLLKTLKSRATPYKLMRVDPVMHDALYRLSPDVIVINTDDPASSPALAEKLSGMISLNKNRQIVIAVGEGASNYRANIRTQKIHPDTLDTAVCLSRFYNDDFDEPRPSVRQKRSPTLTSATELLKKISRKKRPEHELW